MSIDPRTGLFTKSDDAPLIEYGSCNDWGHITASAYKTFPSGNDYPSYNIKIYSDHSFDIDMLRIILTSITKAVTPEEYQQTIWNKQSLTGIDNPVPLGEFCSFLRTDSPDMETKMIEFTIHLDRVCVVNMGPYIMSNKFEKFLSGWFERLVNRIVWLKCPELKDIHQSNHQPYLSNLKRDGITHKFFGIDSLIKCPSDSSISTYNYKDKICIYLTERDSKYRFNVALKDERTLISKYTKDEFPFSAVLYGAMRSALIYLSDIGCSEDMQNAILHSVDPYNNMVWIGVRSGQDIKMYNCNSDFDVRNIKSESLTTEHEPIIRMLFDLFADDIIDSFVPIIDSMEDEAKPIGKTESTAAEETVAEKDNVTNPLKLEDYSMICKYAICVTDADITLQVMRHKSKPNMYLHCITSSVPFTQDVVQSVVASFFNGLNQDEIKARWTFDGRHMMIAFRCSSNPYDMDLNNPIMSSVSRIMLTLRQLFTNKS